MRDFEKIGAGWEEKQSAVKAEGDINIILSRYGEQSSGSMRYTGVGAYGAIIKNRT